MTTININERIAAAVPTNEAIAKIPAKKPKRASLDDAIAKVWKKALKSKSDYKPESGESLPDLIYRFDEDTGEYFVGLKYGNRWLKEINEGKDCWMVKSEKDKDALIDVLVELTKEDAFNDIIDKARKQSVGRKRS
jgi:hypothetical protein